MTEVNEIKQLLQKLEPVFGSRTKALWYLNLLSGDAKSERRNKELLRLLADKKAMIDYKDKIRLPPPPQQVLNGDYSLGVVHYPDTSYASFGLNDEDFIKHILIAGMTGTGKTNLTFQILRELAKRNKPFLVFDCKRNYCKLRHLPEFKNLKVIRIGDPSSSFRFNPLIPPQGVNPKNWMTLLVDVIGHAFFVAQGVEYFLRKAIDQLYNRFHVFEGKTQYPTFNDVQQYLLKEFVRGREMLWMSSVKRVLAILTFSGLLGDVLNTRSNPLLPELLDNQVVIELDDLATVERVFLVEALMLWIYHFRKTQNESKSFKHAIIIEEAHHIMSARKEATFGQETIIETVVRMIREFGEGIIIIDQEPSKISRSVLANTNCKICFNLGNGWDVKTMATAMNLSPEDSRYIDQLKVGHAIVKLKNRFSEPIHTAFPLVPVW